MKQLLALFCVSIVAQFSRAQQSYKPVIEWKKFVPADPRLIVRSGYLIVPENRSKKNSRKIKVPFIFIRRPDQDSVKNISLFSVGGPGYAVTAGIDSIGYQFGYINYGGTIMFDQRGTKKSEPCLECQEVDEAIRKSYRTGRKKDSLVLKAVNTCRERLIQSGVDLSGYTTLECAEDINDLRLALGLDSLNLIGLSYSGGLMLTVARNHPEAVKTLVLRSPLPSNVNYDEHALMNFNEALEQVFINSRTDSTDKAYDNLRDRFREYFTNISGKQFKINYLEKGKTDSIQITYTKSDLLEVINDRLGNGEVRGTPKVMVDLMEGNHKDYITNLVDGYFDGNTARALGMRYSVFCSEQVDLADFNRQRQQDLVLPWLAGYEYNNVDKAICKCWNVKPEPASVKAPIYSMVPALIGAGDADPACSVFYNRLMKRTMPNVQLLIRHNAGHGNGFYVNGVDYMKMFLDNPYQKLVSQSKDVIIE